ncbi:MAG: GAF domain-containing protein, partial [Caldilineaceae bacterium]|nr:GAF domain-containing protein [Caldilineaceae bacterium]
MTQNRINIGEISLALSELRDLVDQQRFADYWRAGLLAVSQQLGVAVARLNLVDAYSPSDDHQITVGELAPASLRYLTAWEEALLDSSVDEKDEQTALCVLRGAATFSRLTAPCTALHFRIWAANTLHGVASFVFADGDAATPQTPPLSQSDSDALAAIFQLFATNALHAQRLSVTQTRLDQANILSQISQAITSTLDLRTVFNQATEMVASILNAQAATLFRIDAKRRELVFMIAKGAAAQALEEKRIPLEQGVVGWVAVHGQSLVINNTQESELFNSQIDSQTGFSTRNILCVPLRIQDRTIGVLEVLN